MTDRLAEAESFLAPLEATAHRRRHRSASARLGYVRGRLLAARGDLPGAEAAFEQARARLAALPLPYAARHLSVGILGVEPESSIATRRYSPW